MVEVRNIYKYFFSRHRKTVTKACDGVSFFIPEGKTVGLVGESGCGKTTLGRIILRLIEPDHGKVYFDKIDLTSLKEKEVRPMRKQFQMIFQDSQAAFNPRMRVWDALKEAFLLYYSFRSDELNDLITQYLSRVNLHRGLVHNFIGNLSSGEIKRLDIVRALLVEPRFLIADEPLAPLDISIQSQIVNLFLEVQQLRGITMLFISHDMKMVRMLCHLVLVMFRGKIVEEASKKVIADKPLHPYTQFLWEPRSSGIYLKLPETGCVYKAHCSLYQKRGFPSICVEQEPPLVEVEKGHWVACHFAAE